MNTMKEMMGIFIVSDNNESSLTMIQIYKCVWVHATAGMEEV